MITGGTTLAFPRCMTSTALLGLWLIAGVSCVGLAVVLALLISGSGNSKRQRKRGRRRIAPVTPVLSIAASEPHHSSVSEDTPTQELIRPLIDSPPEVPVAAPRACGTKPPPIPPTARLPTGTSSMFDRIVVKRRHVSQLKSRQRPPRPPRSARPTGTSHPQPAKKKKPSFKLVHTVPRHLVPRTDKS